MKMTMDEQLRLLDQSMAEDVKFSQLLEDRHYDYDDLQYADGLSADGRLNPYQPIPLMDNVERYGDGIPAVSFFSGAGGLDIGFRYAGFRNVIGIEHNELFCSTLRANNPGELVIGPPQYDGDVSRREQVAQLLRENGIDRNFQGVFHGGPPCQSFSIAANQRFSKDGDNFKRTGFDDEEKGTLIFDYIWFIRQFRPLAFLIENVAGIIECDTDGMIRQALDGLRAEGYTIPEPQVLDAAYYGVPQHRRRWIAMGTRGHGALCFPEPQPAETPCGYVLTRPLDHVANHVTRKHNAASVARYCRLKPGQRDQLGRVDRLDPDKPSKTVIAGGVKGGGRSHLHPFAPRTLSVRECARLQTFPDDYVFMGTPARQFTQVGNAVPPMLAYRLALQLRQAILPDL